MKEVRQADAQSLVEGYLQQVISAVGSSPLHGTSSLAVGCTGGRGEISETVYTMRGRAQLPVTEAEQLATLARLRDLWRQQGYRVIEDRTFPDGQTGTVRVESPGDQVEIAVQSTSPATAMAVTVSTPCYQSDEPL